MTTVAASRPVSRALTIKIADNIVASWLAEPTLGGNDALAGCLEIAESNHRTQLRCTRTGQAGWSDLWDVQAVCGHSGIDLESFVVAINERDGMTSVIVEPRGSVDAHLRRQHFADMLAEALASYQAELDARHPVQSDDYLWDAA